jgi:hypothetical protein
MYFTVRNVTENWELTPWKSNLAPFGTKMVIRPPYHCKGFTGGEWNLHAFAYLYFCDAGVL